MKPIHILKLSESRGWSGGAAQIVALSAALRARGHRVTVGCPSDGELWARLQTLNGGASPRTLGQGAGSVPMIETFPFAPFQDYDLGAAWRLAKEIRERRPDVVHAHHSRAHAVALVAKWLGAPPPLVVSRRVSFRVAWNPFSAVKYRTPSVAAYVAVAEDIKDKLVEAGVAAEKVFVVPSGTDTAALRPAVPDTLIQRELSAGDLPVVGKIGHHGPWKGQDIFLKAAAEVLKTHKAVFVAIGRLTDGPELRELAASLGIEKHVRLLGFRRDVPRLLTCMDVSVNAAVDGEGISGALREALAMGVPVVGSDLGGNRELVRDGETGLLFKSGDAKALAAAIVALLDDRARAKKLAEAGRRLVVERFGVEANADRTLDVYAKVLGLGAATARETSGSSAR